MAIIGSGNPALYAELSCVQVAASGTSRTLKISMNCRVNGNTNPSYASWFGYPANWRAVANAGGAWATGPWATLKNASPSWTSSEGLRYFEQTITIDVGTTSSKSITVGVDVDSFSGSSAWDGSQHFSFTVGSTNTAPWMNGSVTLKSSSDYVLSGIIPENLSIIKLEWAAGGDAEQGSSGLKYGVNQILNGVSTTVLYPTTALTTTRDIGVGNQGQTISYYVDCRDNNDVLSGNKATSATLTKNTLTGASLTTNDNITYNTSALAFQVSGAKNTITLAQNNLAETFTYDIACSNNITVYNGTGLTENFSMSIYKTGALPTGCYVRFDDIKNLFASSSYQGNLTFTLTTKNSYGSSRTTSKVIGVDLQATPTTVPNLQINQSGSTIVKTIGSNKFYVPDGVGYAQITWTSIVGQVGESVSYQLYYAIGAGSSTWIKIADVPAAASSGLTLSYNHIIATLTAESAIKYRVIATTTYNQSSTTSTSETVLHYYQTPTITIGNITRTDSSANIPFTATVNTSIPNISITGSWSSTNGQSSSSLSPNPIVLSSLVGDRSYTLTFTYNDTTGFGSNRTTTASIAANAPIFFVNKYGVGVGGNKADADSVLNVKGDLKINNIKQRFQALGGGVNLNDLYTQGEYIQSMNANAASGQNYPEAQAGHLSVYQGAGVTQVYRVYNSSRSYTRSHYGNGTWTPWAREYNTENKPTANDVGALPSTGGVITGGNIQFATPERGLVGTNGNTIFRQNTDGFLVTSSAVENGTIYLRPNGNTNQKNEFVLKGDGHLTIDNKTVPIIETIAVDYAVDYSFQIELDKMRNGVTIETFIRNKENMNLIEISCGGVVMDSWNFGGTTYLKNDFIRINSDTDGAKRTICKFDMLCHLRSSHGWAKMDGQNYLFPQFDYEGTRSFRLRCVQGSGNGMAGIVFKITYY